MSTTHNALAPEMLDVVDHNDCVVDQGDRNWVHQHGLLHRSVHVIVHHQQKALMQLRGHKQKANPGLWDSSIAGHVNAGESYEQAAEREALEEMGMQLSGLKALGKIPPDIRTGNEFRCYYLVHSTQKPRPAADEVAAIRWLYFADLDDELRLSPQRYTLAFRQIWQILKHHLPK